MQSLVKANDSMSDLMNKKILLDEEYLSSDYLPTKLLFREKELEQLINNLRNNVNTLLVGPVGSGKTALIKLAIKAVQKEAETHYVDCAIYDTQYSVLREILPKTKFMMYKSVYELIKYLTNVLRESRHRMIVCFDNFHKLKEPEIVKKVMSLGVNVALVGSVMRNDLVLTENVISNVPSLVKLRNYSKEEALTIIKDRAKRAIVSNAYSDDVLELIADRTHGNITRALGILRFACIEAQMLGKEKIDSISDHLLHNPVNLSGDEQVLLRILENKKEIHSSELYKDYSNYVIIPKGKRCFRKYLQNLRSLNFVKALGNNSARVYQMNAGSCLI